MRAGEARWAWVTFVTGLRAWWASLVAAAATVAAVVSAVLSESTTPVALWVGGPATAASLMCSVWSFSSTVQGRYATTHSRAIRHRRAGLWWGLAALAAAAAAILAGVRW